MTLLLGNNYITGVNFQAQVVLKSPQGPGESIV